MMQHGDIPQITRRLLREHPLPQPEEGGDKNGRGRVLVVGGGPEMPGAVVLAATAALRAGAGKVRVMTAQSVAPWVATAVPESRVIGLPETSSGGLEAGGASRIVEASHGVDAVLVGPGLVDEPTVVALLRGIVPHLAGPVLVLDAAALAFVSEDPQALHPLGGRAILTPHATEMSLMLKLEEDAAKADPPGIAKRAAVDSGAVITLKGAKTFIAGPDGDLFLNLHGNSGLATSGSGDTLAGIIAGLAARGAPPVDAAIWGVHLHARAGDVLAERVGPLGYLARELSAEVPALMYAVQGQDSEEAI